MAELDDLPDDQRAVLQLLVKQGQTYEDISGLLSIDTDAVRARAHAALEALGPAGGRRLAPERRAEVSDYLLGQQDDERRAGTRELLAGSASARAWARVVADSLRPLGADKLPDIPEEAPAPTADEAPAPATDEAPAGDHRTRARSRACAAVLAARRRAAPRRHRRARDRRGRPAHQRRRWI